MTPHDDVLTPHGLLVALAIIGLALAAHLIRNARRRGLEATSAAVTTRGFDLCTVHGRPMRGGKCLQCIPFDQELADPDFSAWEQEIGGAA